MSAANETAPRRVLVIDDQAEIHADFRKILCPPGAPPSLHLAKARLFGAIEPALPRGPRFEVHSALQGQDGVRAAARARDAGASYQVVFVDMRMPPGWDGVDTIQKLWEADPAAQVVICTAYSDNALDRVASTLGHADRLLILKKPFEPIEVLQLATALSEKWHAERDAELRVEQLERMVKERTEAIEHEALHDRLTGLPNRALLLERLSACVEIAQRDPSRHYALLFVDLDRFKTVNDALGHEIGDQLLVHAAERLRHVLRATDVVTPACTPARLGGDEFLVLLEGVRSTADAARVAERVLAALAEPCEIGPHRLAISASVGVATGERGYASAGAIVRDADIAMYRAKSEGRGRYVLFDASMHREVSLRLALEADLREAVEHDELELHYQPIVDLADGRLLGFEALVRWTHATRGPVSAEDLIGVAEESGLIQPLGLQLLRRACRQLAEWHATIPSARGTRVTVNLSRRQLVDPEFSRHVAEVVRDSGVDPTRLGLEITETSVLHDIDGAIAVLSRLRRLGAAILLDDFGSGYSAIAHLHRLPLDAVKLDGAFLAEARKDARQATALAAVVSIARAFGLRIVAEGIETPAQLEMVRGHGIDLGQGHLYAPSVTASEAEALLRAGAALGASA